MKMKRRRTLAMDRTLGLVSGHCSGDVENSRANTLPGAGNFSAWKTTALFCIVAGTLLVRTATAAQLAILRNGFSIRHERHLVMGTTTRLYLAADDSSFTDVPTE